MRTLRLSLAGSVILVLLGGLGGAVMAQSEEASGAEVASETVFELLIPSEALPEDFVKLVVEQWTLAAGSDSSDDFAATASNEWLRGRAIVVDSGEFVITPVTDALLWRGAGTDREVAPAGETVSVAVGDAIFLPAIPDAEVDAEAVLGLANPGSEDATALSFHTHQRGGTFYGFPQGLMLGDWDMAFSPQTMEPFDDIDVLFRLTRITGGPGAPIPLPDAPTIALYYVEEGDLELTMSGPGGDFVFEWPAGRNGSLTRNEGIEESLDVVGDAPASILELSAIPQPLPAE